MRLALVGYGRMGHAVEDEAIASAHEITARLTRHDLTQGVESLAAALSGADAAVDFSTGDQVADTIAAAQSAGVDLVVGTTNLDARGERALGEVTGIGLVHGPNFSIGVHMFFRMIREAGRLAEASGGYDVSLHERHHRHKRDHPSGTAVHAAEILLEELGSKHSWQMGPPAELADPTRLYVTSIRAGEIPGTHVVALEGAHDRVEVRHEARNRKGFAQGALRAAEWVTGRRGVYRFEDVMDDLFDKTHK